MAPIPSPADVVRRGGWTATSLARATSRPREIARGVVIGAIVTVVALAAKGALVTGTEAGVAYVVSGRRERKRAAEEAAPAGGAP